MSSIPKPKKKKWYTRFWFWALAIIGLLVVVSVAYGAVNQANNKFAKYNYLQKSTTVEKRDLSKVISTSGTIVADESVALTAPLGGTVDEVNYSVGDEIVKDDVLVKAGGIDITAPFDGRVLAVNTFVGDQANPAIPVVEVGFRSSHIEFYASESEAIDLESGQSVEFSVPSYNGGRDEFDGEVTFVDVKKNTGMVSATGEVSESGFLVKVSTDNVPEELQQIVGLTVDMDITAGTADNVTSVDIAAIQYNDDNEPFVYLVPTINDAFVTRIQDAEEVTDVLDTTSVTLGFRGDDYVEITDGLRDGDDVLLYIPQSATGDSGQISGF